MRFVLSANDVWSPTHNMENKIQNIQMVYAKEKQMANKNNNKTTENITRWTEEQEKKQMK